jgi:Nucleoside 2-deoxyribosyltransferase like
MQYVEAPETYDGHQRSLFLAGGIVGCPDWQRQVVEHLRDTELTLLNPRRANFPIDDPSAAEHQITWEHHHLRKATAICFWFPCETLCPIVLYELGAWSMTEKRVFIGVHPDYQRRQDVVLQTGLARPDVTVVLSVPALVAQIRQWDVT